MSQYKKFLGGRVSRFVVVMVFVFAGVFSSFHHADAVYTNITCNTISPSQTTGETDSAGYEMYDLNLKPELLERVVGTKDDLNVEPIKINESLMLNVNSTVTVGIVDKVDKSKVHVRLKRPVCAFPEDRVTISRMIGSRFRLIGYSNGILG